LEIENRRERELVREMKREKNDHEKEEGFSIFNKNFKTQK